MKEEHGVFKKDNENFTKQERKIAQQIRRKLFFPPSSLHFKAKPNSSQKTSSDCGVRC